MKYIFKTSLQRITLVKIATQLWNLKDIRNLLAKLNLDSYAQKKWQKIENQVIEKMSQLPLPELLKKDLISVIRPIGHQIRTWCSYHRKDVLILRLPKHFSWTPEGSIDRKRTAEMLVNDDTIYPGSRFTLACTYCLVDQIPELWKQISEVERWFYTNQSKCYLVPELVKFWTCQLTGNVDELDMIIKRKMGISHPPPVYALLCAIKRGNVVATEFFFDKLSDEERDTLLEEYAGFAAGFCCTRRGFHSQVFFFLHSQMTQGQQLELLESYPHHVASSFLDFPMQPLFLDAVERTVHLVFENHYKCLVRSITLKIVNGWTDFDYRQLFHDLWRLIPLALKSSFLFDFNMTSELLKAGEVEILEQLFLHANAVEMERLIFSAKGQNLCVELIDKCKWRSLELFIEQCVPSKKRMVEFKERFFLLTGSDDENRLRRETFRRLLDDLTAKKSQKRDEKEDDNPSKKLRTE